MKHFNDTHGHTKSKKPSRTYYAWTSMRSRCANPSKESYPRYGGRGISVCERWRIFENFLKSGMAAEKALTTPITPAGERRWTA